MPAEARSFGKLLVGASKVALASPCGLAMALSDMRPVLPGHVIVAPTRLNAARLSDLSLAELDALFDCVRDVQSLLGRGASGARRIYI